MLATEVSKPAVAAAGENLAANGVSNVAIARLTAEELGTAWRGERSFERLRLAGVDLAAMSFSTILVSTAGPPDLQSHLCWHAGWFRPAMAAQSTAPIPAAAALILVSVLAAKTLITMLASTGELPLQLLMCAARCELA